MHYIDGPILCKTNFPPFFYKIKIASDKPHFGTETGHRIRKFVAYLILSKMLNQLKHSIGGCEQKKSVKGQYLLCVGCLGF